MRERPPETGASEQMSPSLEMVERRLSELRPALEEYVRLLAVLQQPRAEAPGGPIQTRKHARPGAMRDSILKALATGPHTRQELSLSLGVPPARLSYNLRRLSVLGIVVTREVEDTEMYELNGSEQTPKAPL
jgi:DNA-binding transcriptional ArsR family regulator